MTHQPQEETQHLVSSEDRHFPEGSGLLDWGWAVCHPGYRLEQVSLLRITGEKRSLTSVLM